MPESAERVGRSYAAMRARLVRARDRLRRPLTYAEKLLLGHLAEGDPGDPHLRLRPDRVALQDATAQTALLQVLAAGLRGVAVPTTVHADHLVRARTGAGPDLAIALEENAEVYEFLAAASRRFGMEYWPPGAGIIHQVLLEGYAFPGGLLLGTDSHIPNAGGVGMLGFGVGGADAVEVLAGLPWELPAPRVIGVRLSGRLSGWASPKDVGLRLLRLASPPRADHVLEYFGPGAGSLSATGKATIANMGTELGALSSVFPYDEAVAAFLRATGRDAVARLADEAADLLAADPEVEARPERFFAHVIDVDLDTIEPHVAGPHRPERARPHGELAGAAAAGEYPDAISAALLGSCTNSSYEDLWRAADLARQATARGLRARIPLFVAPGSERVRATAERDGLLGALEAIGAITLASACGPCVGLWKRDDVRPGDRASILTTFNRNARGRNDGNPDTCAFLASPELAVAHALAGRLSFDPTRDALRGPDGEPFRFAAPGPAPQVPERGFAGNGTSVVPPAERPEQVEIRISPTSERLQRLDPFPPWPPGAFEALPVLFKARGRCTTDHISPGGRWLRYRGHLDRISDNLFLGAVNALTGEAGKATNVLTDERRPVALVAREYKAAGLGWILVGDTEFGEGASREHAALSPRYLGCAAVLARSFARSFETNLKRQGILALTFTHTDDYDLLGERTRVTLVVAELAPGLPVAARLVQPDGSTGQLELRHTLSAEQLRWFHAGSALGCLRAAPAATP